MLTRTRRRRMRRNTKKMKNLKMQRTIVILAGKKMPER
jgi:hypothetical protein